VRHFDGLPWILTNRQVFRILEDQKKEGKWRHDGSAIERIESEKMTGLYRAGKKSICETMARPGIGQKPLSPASDSRHQIVVSVSDI